VPEPLQRERLDHDLGLGGKMSDRSRVRLLKSRWHPQRRRNDLSPFHPYNAYHTLCRFSRAAPAGSHGRRLRRDEPVVCLPVLLAGRVDLRRRRSFRACALRDCLFSASRPSPRLAMARSSENAGRQCAGGGRGPGRSPWLAILSGAALRALTRPTAKIRSAERADRTLRGRVGPDVPPGESTQHDLTDVPRGGVLRAVGDDNGTRHRRFRFSSPSSETHHLHATALGHRPPDHGDQPVCTAYVRIPGRCRP